MADEKKWYFKSRDDGIFRKLTDTIDHPPVRR